MIRRGWLAGWLVVVWVALWGDLTAGNIVGGVVVSVTLLMAFPGIGPQAMGPFRPLRAARFLVYFLYKLVEANVVVAWEVITPNNEGVNEGIVAVPITPGATDAVVTAVANAISLTPGTLTLEVRRDPPTLYVHVLHLRSIEQVREDVRYLEWLVLRAFADEATLARARPPVRGSRGLSDSTRDRLKEQ